MVLVAALAGCQANPLPRVPAVTNAQPAKQPVALIPNHADHDHGLDRTPSVRLSGPSRPVAAPQTVEMGTGRFIGPEPAPAASARVPSVNAGSAVMLDFVNVDIREVLRNVLGDVLGLTYVVDPTVQGAITLQTGKPIARDTVLPTLQNTLQLNGIALVLQNGVYQALPVANAIRAARLGGFGGAGFVTRTITPRFVAAVELQKVLEPLLPPGSALQADAARNILTITGSEQTVDDILGNVAVFDVDYLSGMSFALLPLRTAQAQDVVREVTALLASAGPIAGLTRLVPIERLNAVLIVTQQPRYLSRIQGWVERFDRSNSAAERQLFVYRVQNGRAADLASVLQKTLGIAASVVSASKASRTNPSADPDSLNAANRAGIGVGVSGNGGGVGAPPGGLAQASGPSSDNPLLEPLPATLGTGGPETTTPGSSAFPLTGNGETTGLRVTADEINNALVIRATTPEYAQIESVLQRLDILPLQVVIEATIAEVTLNDQLSYGLQYYLKSGNFSALLASTAPAGTVTSPFQGFSFGSGFGAAFSTVGGGSSFILQALRQVSDVRVLSSPNLLVLNNQSGRLQVGDQVPIATQSAISSIGSNAPIVNSIEYRDTGVILRVTPRVNASGLVLLDIAQEVSQVSTTTSSNLDSPTISQRRVTSSVAVTDGQTIALAGLIQDSRNASKNGIPILQDIPFFGTLFGNRSNQNARTELIVLITPRIIRGQTEAEAVADELQRKLPLAATVAGRTR